MSCCQKSRSLSQGKESETLLPSGFSSCSSSVYSDDESVSSEYGIESALQDNDSSRVRGKRNEETEPGLLSLGVELLGHVASFLNNIDRQSLSLTCQMAQSAVEYSLGSIKVTCCMLTSGNVDLRQIPDRFKNMSSVEVKLDNCDCKCEVVCRCSEADLLAQQLNSLVSEVLPRLNNLTLVDLGKLGPLTKSQDPVSLSGILQLQESCPQLKKLCVDMSCWDSAQQQGAVLESLSGLKHLQELCLTDKLLESSSVTALSALTSMTSLSMNAEGLQGPDLSSALSGLHLLENLHLSGLTASLDSFLPQCSHLTHIHSLDLQGCQGTADQLAPLQLIGNLRHLTIRQCPALEQRGRSNLPCWDSLDCLTSVNLDFSLHADDLKSLSALPALTNLSTKTLHTCTSCSVVMLNLKQLEVESLEAVSQYCDQMHGESCPGDVSHQQQNHLSDIAGPTPRSLSSHPLSPRDGCPPSPQAPQGFLLKDVFPGLVMLKVARVSTEALASLWGHPTLAKLVVYRAEALTQSSWCSLPSCPCLTALVILQTYNVFSRSLDLPLHHWRTLREVQLREFHHLDDLGLWSMMVYMKDLRTLHLSGAPLVSDRGLSQLAAVENLQRLYLGRMSNISDLGVRWLVEGSRALRVIVVQKCVGTTPGTCQKLMVMRPSVQISWLR